MEKPRRLVSLANAFGAFGYISVFFQWTWTLLLAAYPILINNPDFLLPQPDKGTIIKPIEIDPGLTPVMTVIAIVMTMLVLVAAAVAIARLPKAIGKKANALTQSTVKKVLPVLTHHKKVSKKMRQKLSIRVVITIKLLIVTLPLFVLVFVAPTSQLSVPVMWAVGIFAATCSVCYFAVQALLAWLGKITYKDLW